jgi:hypothetical protein
MSNTFTLDVHVDDDAIEELKKDGYQLCIAKKVMGKYTVVWEGRDFMNENHFEWQEQYEIFTVAEFKEGLLTEATDDPQAIASGQTCLLDANGVLGDAQGPVDSSGVFHLDNDFGEVHVAVSSLLGGTFKPIFVTPENVVRGIVDLEPINNIMVWFDNELTTSMMFEHAVSRNEELEYEGSTFSHSIKYSLEGGWSNA